MRLETWAHSEIGLVRKSNQDALGVFPDLGLFILADGMGGHARGEVASRMAVEAIHASLREIHAGNPEPSLGTRMARLIGHSPEPQSIEARLRTALDRANRVIVAAGAQGTGDPAERSMGSTAVVLMVAAQERRASWAHVGDSRLYRMRGGELELLTADHTLPGDRYRSESIIPTNLQHTNVLLQALGTQPDVEVAVGAADIEPGDLFLLCSDGVSGMVSPAFIESCLRNPPSLAAAGQQLIRGALDGGGRDNATLILVRVMGP